MKLRIRLFGILADMAGKPEIVIEINNEINTVSLLNKINKNYPEFEKTNYTIALNKKVVIGNQRINETDEIALLPPFAGG